jgi:HAD superfamily hydrolase (TIGR01549 family)
MASEKITHLTFDFFGTLVQYNAGHFSGNLKYKKSFHYLIGMGYTFDYEMFAKEYSDIYSNFITTALKTKKEFHIDEVTAVFLKRNTIEAAQNTQREFTQLYLDAWNTGVTYYPHIKPFIKKLKKNYSLSIISNTNYALLVKNNLEKMGIYNDFDLIITSVEHGTMKPNPEIFHDTLKKLQVNPANAMHIGDNYTDDYLAAIDAGMKSLLIDVEKKYVGNVTSRVDSLFAIESLL